MQQSVAAPATVSGESASEISHWETGKAGRRQRPASQETCQRSHPTGGRGVHTERLFAAVTSMPMRRPCGDGKHLPRLSRRRTSDGRHARLSTLACLRVGLGLTDTLVHWRRRANEGACRWGHSCSTRVSPARIGASPPPFAGHCSPASAQAQQTIAASRKFDVTSSRLGQRHRRRLDHRHHRRGDRARRPAQTLPGHPVARARHSGDQPVRRRERRRHHGRHARLRRRRAHPTR